MGEVLIFQESGREEEGTVLSELLSIVTEEKEAEKALLCHPYRLILIHLEEDDEAGMQLAFFIRGIPRYYLTPILFLAKSHKYEKQAFHDIHCYDYLIKPIRQEDIIKIIYPLLTQIFTEKEESKMLFRIHGITHLVNIHDIIYMESGNRCVTVHTTGTTLEVPYLRLSHCLAKYGNVFVRCHRSILVNRSFVRRIDYNNRYIELAGGTVDIGRHYQKDVRREFDGWESSHYNKGQER